MATFVNKFHFLFSRWLRGKLWNPQYDLRMDGKVVIVTGANSGIGLATALDLAKRGARIYLACRSADKGEVARAEIIKETDNQEVFCRQLDLASMQSIREFVAGFTSAESRLDVLINNAGWTGPRRTTVDGFEMQIGVNHMGHFLLTNLLVDTLQKSAPSRVITLTSVAHRVGKINKLDLNSEKSYRSFCAYAQSKLANILFTRELARRLSGSGVTANSVNPGPVHTDFANEINCLLRMFWMPVSYFMFKDVHSGAQTSIRLAVDPKLETTTGRYFRWDITRSLEITILNIYSSSNCEITEEHPRAKNDEDARWLWGESCKWTLERV